MNKSIESLNVRVTDRKVKTGEVVILNPSLWDMFESAANTIFDVVDSRIQNGIYTFSLRPVGAPSWSNSTHEGMFAEDLLVIG